MIFPHNFPTVVGQHDWSPLCTISAFCTAMARRNRSPYSSLTSQLLSWKDSNWSWADRVSMTFWLPIVESHSALSWSKEAVYNRWSEWLPCRQFIFKKISGEGLGLLSILEAGIFFSLARNQLDMQLFAESLRRPRLVVFLTNNFATMTLIS